jgi:rubrerythrin
VSAGKGDRLRPVNGDRYRRNYEAIFAPKYPAWICRPCGEAHGRGMPAGHVSTWHEDTCGICGKVTPCSEPRDFGHLKKWPIKNP